MSLNCVGGTVFLVCPHAIKSCIPRIYPWRHARDKMHQPLPLLNRESPGTKLALPSISGIFKMSFLKIINYSPYCHSQHGQMPYNAWTINEPHLPKNRSRCYVKSPTVQDTCDRSQILIYHVFGACHQSSLVPRSHPFTRRNSLVNQVKFLGLAGAFATV